MNLYRSLPALFLFAAFTFTTSAHAGNYTASGSGGGYDGSGTLTATEQADGSYLITAVSGEGSPALYAPGTFPAMDNDNLLFPDGSSYVDSNGFAFTISSSDDTDNVDIFASSASSTGYYAYIIDVDGYLETIPVTFDLTDDTTGSTDSAETASPMVFSFSFRPAMFSSQPPAVTPEPSSIALLGTGIAGLCAAVRRRRVL